MPINYLKQIYSGKFTENCYRIAPTELMKPFIEGFYIFTVEEKNKTQLIFNDGFPVLVFLQDIHDSVEVIEATKNYQLNAAWASAGSIQNVYIRHNSVYRRLFVVRFHPGNFYNLFNRSIIDFKNNPLVPFSTIALENNFDFPLFLSKNSIPQKIAYFESYIIDHDSYVRTEILTSAFEHIQRERARITVKDLTLRMGVSYKWLERCFVKNVRILPKEYIQLNRFLYAYLALLSCRKPDLIRIAVSNGYYDSNHFVKDFKACTGKTPLEYLKNQHKFINNTSSE